MSNNALMRPSDMNPECRECGSDVFVSKTRTRATGWKCHVCGIRWFADGSREDI